MIGRGKMALLFGAWLSTPGCTVADTRHADAPPAGTVRPADSLVLVGPRGITVWFTDVRQAIGPDGVACLERALEIRTDTSRLTVPLLYTREAPTALEDTTMRAVLSKSCEPAGGYRVDYAFARPRPLPNR
ncbi:MAG: hypothetical protein AAB075_07810 [Gemmatimonadota bacterium]